MCTAISYHGKHHFFGRNLDFESSFGEKVIETPSDFSFPFGKTKYTILGMAHIEEEMPLYYDGMNEKGLAMAGLLFSGYGVYHPFAVGKNNIPSWAFLPWILGRCADVSEAEELLKETNLRSFLIELDDFIVMYGLDENDNMTAFGHEAQAVYDEIYMCNE